jgi:DNA ligase D-like protein (predicted 3'-phosphoesterase)
LSSFTHQYCCFTREPHWCSQLKEICRPDSEVVKSFTGIETSPKEIVAEPSARAAMAEDLEGGGACGGRWAPWGAQKVGELSSSVKPHHNRRVDRRPGAGRGRGLTAYRAKRAASRTPEPFEARAARPRLFVVQQHQARRLHYDLRLEWNGVLLSWAVPKGPSLDPGEKRLAVHVEDHPLDYADFEGVIPEGNYGAGAVIVWDLGRWTPLADPARGLAAGKLDFVLHGHKLRGRFALVRTGGRRAAAAGGRSGCC